MIIKKVDNMPGSKVIPAFQFLYFIAESKGLFTSVTCYVKVEDVGQT